MWSHTHTHSDSNTISVLWRETGRLRSVPIQGYEGIHIRRSSTSRLSKRTHTHSDRVVCKVSMGLLFTAYHTSFGSNSAAVVSVCLSVWVLIDPKETTALDETRHHQPEVRALKSERLNQCVNLTVRTQHVPPLKAVCSSSPVHFTNQPLKVNVMLLCVQIHHTHTPSFHSGTLLKTLWRRFVLLNPPYAKSPWSTYSMINMAEAHLHL